MDIVKNTKEYIPQNIVKSEYKVKISFLFGSDKFSHKAKIVRLDTYKNGVIKSTLVGQLKRTRSGDWKVMGYSDVGLEKAGLLKGFEITKKGYEFFGLNDIA